MKFKKFTHAAGAAIFGLTAVFALAFHFEVYRWHKIEPGFVGVVVDHPYFNAGAGGVRENELIQPGSAFFFKTTDVIKVRITPDLIEIEHRDLPTNDEYLVGFKSRFRFIVTDPVRLVENFNPNWFGEVLEYEYRSGLREYVGVHAFRDLVFNLDSITYIEAEMRNHLRTVIKKKNIPVKLVSVGLSMGIPHPRVQDQIVLTQIEEQKKNTLRESVEAQKLRVDKEKARGRADNAYRTALHMTPEQFTRYLIAIETTRPIGGRALDHRVED